MKTLIKTRAHNQHRLRRTYTLPWPIGAQILLLSYSQHDNPKYRDTLRVFSDTAANRISVANVCGWYAEEGLSIAE